MFSGCHQNGKQHRQYYLERYYKYHHFQRIYHGKMHLRIRQHLFVIVKLDKLRVQKQVVLCKTEHQRNHH